MNIEPIKEKLEILGYDLGVKGHNFLSVGKMGEPLEGFEELLQYHLYCFVSLEEDGTYLIFYGNTIVQSKIEMSFEYEVINWIKKEYPLQ